MRDRLEALLAERILVLDGAYGTAIQARTLADGTKDFTERMREVSQKFAQNASNAMAESRQHAQQAVSNIGFRAEQTSRRQPRAEA